MVRNCEPLTKMETTFYDEQYHNGSNNNVNQLKRSLTLDLAQAKLIMKRPRMENNNSPIVLSSPDLNLLQLRTPELDKLILNQTGTVGEVPATPNSILFPKVVTEAQEDYARGFITALNELQNSDSSQGVGAVSTVALQSELPSITTTTSITTTLSGGTYTNLDQYQMNGGNYLENIIIKDEPQTVPTMGSPPVSPIDMECQERIKLERKRQRNRVAASKCRRRKLERISKLEDKVKLLKGENTELSSVVNKLKQQVSNLKLQVMEHVQAGCLITITSTYQ